MTTPARAKTLYVKAPHQRVWNEATAAAAAAGISLSDYVVQALMEANDKRRGESQ